MNTILCLLLTLIGVIGVIQTIINLKKAPIIHEAEEFVKEFQKTVDKISKYEIYSGMFAGLIFSGYEKKINGENRIINIDTVGQSYPSYNCKKITDKDFVKNELSKPFKKLTK